MKKHTVKSKLAVNIQTVRSLQQRDLATVVGGATTTNCLTTTLTGNTYKPYG